MENTTAESLYAELYDVSVPDWPGEVDFYRETISDPGLVAKGVLEVACGTGRITRKIAQQGIGITGLDISPELLSVAIQKSTSLTNINWMLGDMRSFNLNQKFGYVIIPGHSFQFMVTSEEQVECLEHIKHHLIESGVLIIHLDHQDFGWLAGLLDQKEPVYDEGSKVTHPETGKIYRKSSAWSFEPATQTATARTKWEELNQTNDVIQTWEMAPKKLHCVFRFEMEHLLIRAGFIIEAVYGDFYKHPLTDNSGEMIWLARTQ